MSSDPSCFISLGESDPGKLATLKSQFNSAVDEYEKMRNILEGKLIPATSTGGQAMKTYYHLESIHD